MSPLSTEPGALACAAIALALVVSCSGDDPVPDETGSPDVPADHDEAEAYVPPPAPAPSPELLFVDISAWAGLDGIVGGRGATFVDFDSDGYDDLIIPAADEATVFRNNTDGSFSRVGSWPHPGTWGEFAFVVDLTGDGRPEVLYVLGEPTSADGGARSGEEGARDVAVLSVDAAGQPTELTTLLPALAGDAAAQVVTFGDYDGDGGQDIYVCYMTGQEFDADGRQTGALGAADRYYRRMGATFVDGTALAKISGTRPSQSAVTVDLDGDGHLDVLVGTDFGRPDQVYLGDGAGTFSDQAEALGFAQATSAMGFAVADADGDGDLDAYLTDNASWGHTYYRQDAPGTFVFQTEAAGFGDTASHTGWGVGFHDVDHDGDLDLFAANGRVCVGCVSAEEENQLFLNDGKGHFTLAEPSSPETGLYVVANSRAALFSDIDADGDLDILVTNVRGAPTLLRNELGAQGHWLQLLLKDPLYTPPVGAIVTLKAEGRTLRRWVKGTPSFGGSSTGWVHFGLGGAESATEATVRWPDGSTQSLGTLAADQRIIVEKTTAPHRDPATLNPVSVPTCAELCGQLASCGALEAFGVGDQQTCTQTCDAEGVGDQIAACVVNAACDLLELCGGPDG